MLPRRGPQETVSKNPRQSSLLPLGFGVCVQTRRVDKSDNFNGLPSPPHLQIIPSIFSRGSAAESITLSPPQFWLSWRSNPDKNL